MYKSNNETTVGYLATHLDGEGESSRVERVFSIQLAVHSQRSADVVQGKDAVGVPWKDGWIDGERERERESQTKVRDAEWQVQLLPRIILQNSREVALKPHYFYNYNSSIIAVCIYTLYTNTHTPFFFFFTTQLAHQMHNCGARRCFT